nr:PKD domain-containing protein [Gemmatimonadales bacterium]
GSHDKYKTDGKFDLAKWQAVMDAYNTSAIKTAVAEGVADGTIVMNNVMDEPQTASWGGVMTKSLLDQMATYVRGIFPTLPIGVTHIPEWRTAERYQVMDAILTQYLWRRGDVTAWRDMALAVAQQNGVALVFSINILNGGVKDDVTEACPIPLTGGTGTSTGLCRMTADQVRDWGRFLGVAGCAMSMWRYDDAFMANPENQQAFRDVAATLATVPGRPCRRVAGGTPPPINTPPTAAFAAPSCTTGVACQFTDASSDTDGSIASRSWQFGNGLSATGANPTTTYATAGSYNVTLKVTDNLGAQSSVTRSVTVGLPNTPPVAAFAAPSCAAGVTCGFTDASRDDDGTIASRSWEFGNGATATGANPSITFASAGDYNVTLTVTDDDGAESSVTQSVTVGPPPNTAPTAAFDPPSCIRGVACQFNDGSRDDDGTIASWSWEFGNGATATGANPSITFASAGDYDVTLTVTDDDGAENSVTRSVTVGLPANTPPSAAFDAPSCTAGVACGFTDKSSDIDGTIAARRWDFGNGQTSTAVNPSITFAAAGTFSVTLTATDNGGAEGSVTKSVIVASVAPAPATISLSLTGSVKSGRQHVLLTWSGAIGASVRLYRDGVLIQTTANDGTQDNVLPTQGKASYVYKVCETGTSRCSASKTFVLPSILLNVTSWMKEVDLQAMTYLWIGANGATMNVYRNGALIQNTANTGRYTSTRRFSGPATYLLKVCETATSRCSNTVTATFK